MKETNMEHFRSEIEAVEYDFGVEKGVVKRCIILPCRDCEIGNHIDDDGFCCSERKIKWLMSEYKPEPVLTAREKHFVEFAQEGWLARDKSKCLYWYKAKPKKTERVDDYWESETFKTMSLGGFEVFPFITWEDEEPWAVEELRKLKALEYNPEDVAFKGGVVNENSSV